MKRPIKNPVVALFTIISFVFTQSVAMAEGLPTGETVVHGDVTFERTADTFTVNQHANATNKAIIEYQTFGMDANQTIRFNQPNVNSIALNRVVGTDPSQLLGHLSCNGQCWIVNPNDIIFGPGFTADAPGLLASTLNISNGDFIDGNYIFSGKGGKIINNADFSVHRGGYVALLGGALKNHGKIYAPLGSINLASGNKITVGLDALNVISVVVDEAVDAEIYDADGNPIDTAIENTGELHADGGKVLLTSKVLNDVFDYAINNQGVVSAKNLVNGEGFIELVATGAKIKNDVDGELVGGSTIKVTSDDLFINRGDISAETAIDITAGQTTIPEDQINRTTGPGPIVVGPTPNDQPVIDIDEAIVDVEARDIVNIGEIRAEGPVSKVSLVADETLTLARGSRILAGLHNQMSDNTIYLYSFGTAFVANGAYIDASGGARSKDYGFVEISAVEGLGFHTDQVYTKELFFDPETIYIRDTGADSVTDNPGGDGTPDEAYTDHAGSDLFLSAAALLGLNGSITELYLQATRNIRIETNLLGLDYALLFEAWNSIIFDDPVLHDRIGISTLGHDITFRADADNNGSGRLRMHHRTRLWTNGGDFTASAANEIRISRVDTRGASGDGEVNVTSTRDDIRIHRIIGGDVNINAGNRIFERGVQDLSADIIASGDVSLMARNGIDGDYAAPHNWPGTDNGLEVAVQGEIDIFNENNRVRINGLGETNIASAYNFAGDIIVSSSGELTARDVRAVGAGKKVQLSTTNGSDVIIDGIQGSVLIDIDSDGAINSDTLNNVHDLTARRVELTAQTGIGNAGPLLTRTFDIAAENVNNDIDIFNAGTNALSIDSSTNTNGNTKIVASTPLTVNGAVTSGGDITLTAANNGGNDDHLTVNADVQSTVGGTINFNAGTDFVQNAGTISTTGRVNITAERNVDESGGTIAANELLVKADGTAVSLENLEVDALSVYAPTADTVLKNTNPAGLTIGVTDRNIGVVANSLDLEQDGGDINVEERIQTATNALMTALTGSMNINADITAGGTLGLTALDDIVQNNAVVFAQDQVDIVADSDGDGNGDFRQDGEGIILGSQNGDVNISGFDLFLKSIFSGANINVNAANDIFLFDPTETVTSGADGWWGDSYQWRRVPREFVGGGDNLGFDFANFPFLLRPGSIPFPIDLLGGENLDDIGVQVIHDLILTSLEAWFFPVGLPKNFDFTERNSSLTSHFSRGFVSFYQPTGDPDTFIVRGSTGLGNPDPFLDNLEYEVVFRSNGEIQYNFGNMTETSNLIEVGLGDVDLTNRFVIPGFDNVQMGSLSNTHSIEFGQFDAATVDAAGSVTMTAGGNVVASEPATHVRAGADSSISTPNGTIGVEGGNPVDVDITGTLTVEPEGETGGQSGVLTSAADPTNANIPVVQPAINPNASGQNPPGTVFYNGVQIWPPIPVTPPVTPTPLPSFILSQQNDALIERFQFPTPARLNLMEINVVDLVSTRLPGQVFLYHPLGDIDTESYEEGEGQVLDTEFYEFIDGEIQEKEEKKKRFKL